MKLLVFNLQELNGSSFVVFGIHVGAELSVRETVQEALVPPPDHRQV